MKILVLGDPHGDLQKIKRINLYGLDLILITGDLGNADLMRKNAFVNIERRKKGLPEIEITSKRRKRAFMQAYSSSLKVVKYLSRYAPVFTIYGNVESTNPETKSYSKELGLKLPFLTDDLKKIKGVKVINNKKIYFNKIKIGGLQYFVDDCWVKIFKPGDYQERLEESREETLKAEKVLNKFAKTDILICHQPPYGVLDKVTAKFAPKHWKGKHAGSKVILNYIKKYKPQYVFCGHIHEGEGYRKIGKTKVFNLGVCGYKFVNFN